MGWGGGGSNRGGPLEIEFEESLQVALAVRAWDAGELEIGLVTTGDDGDSDCSHSSLDLEVSGVALVPDAE